MMRMQSFEQDFFYQTPNHLADFFPQDPKSLPACLRVIDVHRLPPGSPSELVMDDEQARSAAYLEAD